VTPIPSAKPDGLKPCPFCGVVPPRILRFDDGFMLECLNPECFFNPSPEAVLATEDAAIAAWNRRAPTPKETP
jgi:hypothetical protein